MHCLICDCDMKECPKGKKTYTYDEYVRFLGFCSPKCYDYNDNDEKHNIEFKSMINNIMKYRNKDKKKMV